MELQNAFGGIAPDVVFPYGPPASDWQSIAGDWEGRGYDGVGLYDPDGSAFFLRNVHAGGAADIVFSFGPPGSGWMPISGDWNGDGADTVGLYDPNSSVFFLNDAHRPGAADLEFAYGPPGAGWVPVTGDWNGDGIDTVGLYDPTAGVFHLRNAHAGGPADATIGFGPMPPGVMPVAGDWDGDGIDTIGLYDPDWGLFLLWNANAAAAPDIIVEFGPPGQGLVPIGRAPGSATGPRRLLALVNIARAQGQDCGREGYFAPAPPLTWNGLLAAAAGRHSLDLARMNFFSHTGSDGTTVADRVSATGYIWSVVGENIAAGLVYATPEAVNAAWLDSPGHCANIMYPDFEEFGAAVVFEEDSDYLVYWTEVFGAH